MRHTYALYYQIGSQVEGVELSSMPASGSPKTWGGVDNSVVIIGMRGSRKTHIGRLAAQVLCWTFLDADELFEDLYGVTVRQFVQNQGWDEFRKCEVGVLLDVITTKRKRHIVSLGGGIVETEEARNQLKEYFNIGPVVEIDEVEKYLSAEAERPAYGEPIADVYRRRKPWFDECSTKVTGIQCNYIPSLSDGSA